jgi:K+-sensing histidine kinase KdpD
LDPIDLYVRHTSTICNAVFSRILPWLEPTRYEKTLKHFANYDELWAPAGRARRPWAAAVSTALSQAKQAAVSACVGLRDKTSAALGSLFKSIDPRRHDRATSLNVVAVATAILLAVNISTDIPHLIFAYLLPIIYVAIKFGRVPALIATAATGLCAAFFLYEPLLSVTIDDNLDMAELAAFCASALMISQLFRKRSGHTMIRRR